MFYAPQSPKISNQWTHLDPSQVFTGQYWDEFGLTPHLVPDGAKVLMLGLARGGGIRPILSSTKELHVTAVDLDKALVAECQTQFANDFPVLNFTSLVAEARDYIFANQNLFDCIWLDVYLEDSYSELYFDNDFFQQVRASLTKTGVLMINAYGLPNQFKPLTRGGAQAQHLLSLARVFDFVAAIPHRRNLTFIACDEKPIVYSSSPHPQLNLIDRRSMQGHSLRLMDLQCIDMANVYSRPLESLKFRVMDQHMQSLWPEMVADLQRLGCKLSAPIEILRLIEDPIASAAVLDNALINRAELVLACFPILYAAEFQMRDLNIEWLLNWFLKNAEELRNENPRAFREIWLAQLWAIILRAPERLEKHQNILWTVMEKELP